jgi:uncharacterized protein
MEAHQEGRLKEAFGESVHGTDGGYNFVEPTGPIMGFASTKVQPKSIATFARIVDILKSSMTTADQISASRITAEEIIHRLQLVPLTIEGGYFRETYRSTLSISAAGLPREFGGDRNASTAIYYLVTPDTFSAIHRVKSDEVFHFYAGDPVQMLQLDDAGRGRIVTIGNDLASGQLPQLVVPGDLWQGCRLIPGGRWALMGCTVAPGFDYADFTAANRTELITQYPTHAFMITALTPDP